MAHKEDILIVDDEDDIRMLIAGILEDEGYVCQTANGDKQALEMMQARQPSLIILDVWLRGSEMDGIQILSHLRTHYPDSQVIMISGHATIEVAIKAVKMGAYDFITKPIKTAELLHHIDRALSDMRLRMENRQLKQLSGHEEMARQLIGDSDVIKQVKRQVTELAALDSGVLITGARGTGKSMVAELIHGQSQRQNAKIIPFNCQAFGLEGIENALFGIEARPNAPREIGALEQAHGGSLILEEVQYLSAFMQQKMIKFLSNPVFIRQGGKAEIKVSVRIIATGSEALPALVKSGAFSPELYNRLAVHLLEMPSFAQRREDLNALAAEMLKKACRQQGRRALRLSGGAISGLIAHEWQGNGIELARVIDQAIDLVPSTQQVIESAIWQQALQAQVKTDQASSTENAPIDTAQKNNQSLWLDELSQLPLKEAREAFEAAYISKNLQHHGMNISRTAQAIGMDRAALHRKLKHLNIDVKD